MRKFALLFFVLILSACKERAPQYNGYIDADLTYLSSDFAGRLTNLLVHRGEMVPQNKLLFKAEQTSEHFNVKSGRFGKDSLIAQRKEVIDQLHYAEINYNRTLQMRKQNAASQNDLDVAKQNLDVLKNQQVSLDFQIKSSQVDIANQKWKVARKMGYAPDAGIIFDTYFTQDEYVQAGQPILALITGKNIKVVFFVSEKELSKIALNKKVTISSDGNPKLAVGTIRYISNTAQYTSPLIYSREDRQSLVFRVEAGIDNPNLNQLHLGQPISLEVAL
ncbi:MAG: HlyD family efflux transporter periplasmic adaptor subunit [Legionellaceae bacterium]|nr:HlyD family efflux transporter periplasmic adaptor subunit [Legionellaceae bacterium]